MKNKVVRIGTGDSGDIFCKIELRDKDGFTELSISGVEGPKRNGDSNGSAGQIIMSYKEYDRRGHTTLDKITPAPGWTPLLIRQFFNIWDEWHLNGMRPGCQHQRADHWGDEQLEVVTYHFTPDAYRMRKQVQAKAEAAAIEGKAAELTDTERALLTPDWFKDLHEPPDADSPLSGCYEVKKRETKSANWVSQNEHPRGVLSKPCPTCGYKYGTKWLHEDLPQDVIEFLEKLPDTDKTPAWV